MMVAMVMGTWWGVFYQPAGRAGRAAGTRSVSGSDAECPYRYTG
ncbi:MAG: hypothetical protein QOF29_1863 [bacterium]|jgi:hypothetical protein